MNIIQLILTQFQKLSFTKIMKYLYHMNLDIDFLINFFEKFTKPESKGEIGEQDAPSASAPSSPSSGGSGRAVPKWADNYNIKRGKANMLGKGGEKWESGLTRGLANQIY
jgi:hypothetical protein